MACSRHDSKEKKLFFFTSSSLYSTKNWRRSPPSKLVVSTPEGTQMAHSCLSIYLRVFLERNKNSFSWEFPWFLAFPNLTFPCWNSFVFSCFTCWHGNLLSLLTAASCIRGPENDYNTVRFVISWERKSFIESSKNGRFSAVMFTIVLNFCF